MPSALVRQWCLLTLLPTRPRRVDTATLEERLRSRGLRVHRRTIQRDLVELATVFPIVADERSKPYGWRWADSADLLAAIFSREASVTGRAPIVLRLRASRERATALVLGLRARGETRGDVRVMGTGDPCEIVAPVEDGEALRRWLLGMADVVEIVGPRDLRVALGEMARRAADAHRGDHGPCDGG